MRLPIARLVPVTEAEGPFARVALWTAGCDLGCPGCCNPELFPDAAGQLRQIVELERAIARAHDEHAVEGLTLVGGEPTQHLEAVTELARRVQARGMGVILFSGYTRAELVLRPGFGALWEALDTLVDGRFDARDPEPPPEAGGRRFIGSRNQRLWHRSPRYADPDLWRGANRAEIRIDPKGRVSIHGFPEEVRRARRALAGHGTVPAGRLARRERDDRAGPG